MTTNTLGTNLARRLAVHLDLDSKAAVLGENPLDQYDLPAVTYGAGLDSPMEMNPAKSMAPAWGLGYDMEIARNQAITDGKADKSAKRMAWARQQAERKRDLEAMVAESKEVARLDEKRLAKAWEIGLSLSPLIERLSASKRRWAARYLGGVADDLAQVVLEEVVTVLAASSQDLDLLATAAEQLAGDKPRGSAGDRTDEERKQAKRENRARGWLVRMVRNRVLDNLTNLYTEAHNLSWTNLDLIATVMASITGGTDDPISSHFKASKAPTMVGARFRAPGAIDVDVLQMAMNAAITERGLDLMVEILLDSDNRESGGAVRWSKIAREVFLATPGGLGEHYWRAVRDATAHLKSPKRARAEAAAKHVQNLFEWLPDLIVGVHDAFDIRPVGYKALPGGARAIMASDFEDYLGEPPALREIFVPSLRFGSVEEAVRVLADAMSLVSS